MILSLNFIYRTYFLGTLLSFSCTAPTTNDEKETKIVEKQNNSTIGAESTSNQESSKDCDPRLWKFVYNSDRLQVLDKCKEVTGTIVETNADEDGDQHMLLNLDKGQESLLTERNMKKKEGNLVIEAVCINSITRNKAMGACDGYVNNVQLPAVGDHVKVTGSYVIDSHNGWAEIHPITSVVKK